MPEQTSLSELLAPHAARMAATHLRAFCSDDLDRFARFSRTACGLLIDWSKEKLDEETWRQLLTSAEDRDVSWQARCHAARRPDQRDRKSCCAAHSFARWRSSASDVRHEIAAEKARFLRFAEEVRSGAITASDGQPFTDVINIGIGGSDLGPAMAVRALAPFCDGPKVHFSPMSMAPTRRTF
jgi:glucose-6-phosphate isomerase